MPAARRYAPSVAPITIIGTVATPGQSSDVRPLTALSKSSRIGDGGAPRGAPLTINFTAVSPITLRSVSVTYSTLSSGSTRQLTLAAASCGSAFNACPPSSIVATQVVRSVAFQGVDACASRVIAAVSPFAAAARSALTGPFSIVDIAWKYARVTSFVLSGNPKRDNRSSAPAK